MKYLTIIYYDTFARFFCAIEDCVRRNDPTAEFLHLAIFPSGWLYMKVHGRKVHLLPWKIRKSYASVAADDAELDKIIRYHEVIGVRYGHEYKRKLRQRARNYLNTMAQIVEDFDPDTVLFSGDTRIACEALTCYLDKIQYKGRRFYFEQGPNGTTIFDSQGVNANCSFRTLAAGLTGEGFDPENLVKQKKFNRNPLFRGADYALISILRLFGTVPPEWDTMSLNKLPRSDYQMCIDHGKANVRGCSREILVALQVPDDANNIHHNPLGLGDVDLVRWVLRASADVGLPVRIREHPLYRRRYTADMYQLLMSSDRAILSDSSLDEDLAKAALAVTVNSMTGLDAYLRKIPVIVLGNAFYDHLLGIERVQDESTLNVVLADLVVNGLASRLKGGDPAKIFSEMRAKYFVPGHYLDAELHAPLVIAEMITRDVNK